MKKKIYSRMRRYAGEAFYKQFRSDFDLKCSDIDVNEKWLSFLDFRDFNAYKKDVEDFNQIIYFILAHILI